MLKTFMKEGKKLLKGLKMEYFHFIIMKFMSKWKQKKKEKQEQKKRRTRRTRRTKTKKKKNDAIALNKRIINKETDINKELFKKYVNYQRPSDMLEHLNKTNDIEKNNKLVSVINSGLKGFKEKIKKMPKEKKEIENPRLIVQIVEEILKFNKQN